MKKLLLLLLLVPMVSFGQSSSQDYNDGYKKGFKEGFCYEDLSCYPPYPPYPPYPKYGFDTQKDGYNRGLMDGKAKRDSENTSSTGSSSKLPSLEAPKADLRGSYANPQYVPAAPSTGEQVGKAISDVGAQIGASILANVKRGNEIIVPLKVDLNAFKYVVIKNIDQSGGKSAAKNVIQRINKYLLKQGYNVINLTHKKESKRDAVPEDLELDPSIALYITIWAKDNMSGLQGDLTLFDYSGNLVHQKKSTSLSYNTTSKELSSELISNRFAYSPDSEKYLPVQLSQAEIQYKEQQVESAKDVAMNELKRHKELLDMGVITQEEFDKKAAELKKVILGN